MSTRTPRRRAPPKYYPPSGAHPILPPASFLVLAADPRFAAWLAAQVRAYGNVTAAETVAGALMKQPPAGHWTAALLDTTVADGSGFVVLDALRILDTDLPVLLFSESGAPPVANLAFEKHASLLTKPVLTGHVRMFLESPLVRMHGRDWRERRERMARLPIHEAAILDITETWRERYDLTSTETEILHMALQGHERHTFAKRRGVSEVTIKSQVNRLLAKTEHANLPVLIYDAMYELFFFDRPSRLSQATEPSSPQGATSRRG